MTNLVSSSSPADTKSPKRFFNPVSPTQFPQSLPTRHPLKPDFPVCDSVQTLACLPPRRLFFAFFRSLPHRDQHQSPFRLTFLRPFCKDITYRDRWLFWVWIPPFRTPPWAVCFLFRFFCLHLCFRLRSRVSGPCWGAVPTFAQPPRVQGGPCQRTFLFPDNRSLPFAHAVVWCFFASLIEERDLSPTPLYNQFHSGSLNFDQPTGTQTRFPLLKIFSAPTRVYLIKAMVCPGPLEEFSV